MGDTIKRVAVNYMSVVEPIQGTLSEGVHPLKKRISGSTIITLLHEKMNPKNRQVTSPGWWWFQVSPIV